ncbi:hypothetical protein F5B20DRAFT_534450 [Whalleya microplaca]|nr:hypothetical protein F5B20DRAFT_534450 [Whalleya microplaca]
MARSGKMPSSSSTTTTTSASAAASAQPRRRPVAAGIAEVKDSNSTDKHTKSSTKPLLDGPASSDDEIEAEAAVDLTPTMSWTARNQWIVLAMASGACAAFNGVFAKLTTNDLTSHISHGISGFLGLTNIEKFIEVVVRCIFFGLNLVFNGVMWTLFTQALAKGQSTTQVSIMNTSTNFMITALLGLAIFAESLPPLWWAGAALLVAGNVIIGRKTQEDPQSQSHDDSHDDGEAVSLHGDPASAAELGEGYGTVTTPQTEGVLVPVEKDDDDEQEGEGDGGEEVDEDVALIGDVSGVDGR